MQFRLGSCPHKASWLRQMSSGRNQLSMFEELLESPFACGGEAKERRKTMKSEIGSEGGNASHTDFQVRVRIYIYVPRSLGSNGNTSVQEIT